MKKKNMAERLAAGVMAGAVILTAFGETAFAALENAPVTKLDYKKTVTTDGETYAPNTIFRFGLTPVDHSGDQNPAVFEGNVVSSGVAGGLSLEKGEIAFAPSGTSPAASYEGTDSIRVDLSKFTKPGVYHYQARETIPEEADRYEGMIYDGTVYDLYAFVLRDQTGSLYVKSILCTKPDENGRAVKADLAFTNNYGEGSNDSTHDVTIKKEVTGNMGETDKLFKFQVSVAGGEGEWYKLLVKETGDAAAREYQVKSGEEPVEYAIRDTGTIQILGLSASDTYTVNEQSYTADGYITTNQNNTGTAETDGAIVTVTNHREASIPTGVATTVAPYALLLAFGAAMLAFFGRKKKHLGA